MRRAKTVPGYNLLLIAIVAGEHNLLLAGDVLNLERAVVEEVLDAGGVGIALDILLELDLAGQLSRQLLIDLAGFRSRSPEEGCGKGRCLLWAEGGGSCAEEGAGADGGLGASDGRRGNAGQGPRGGARKSPKRHHVENLGV